MAVFVLNREHLVSLSGKTMSTQKAPKKLGNKLQAIRLYLGYTLEEMAVAVGKEGKSRRARVYEWEKGIRTPDYRCLLAYARLANASTDELIDDAIHLDLQEHQKKER